MEPSARPSAAATGVELTVAMPVFNEAGILEHLHQRVTAACQTAGRSYEILFVNDGSTDGSAALLAGLAERDPHTTVVTLSRNFGHPAAFAAAVDLAGGRQLVVLDGDLQDDPDIIPELLRTQADTGAEVVYVERGRRAEGPLHRLAVQAFNHILTATAQHALPENVGNYSLLGERAVAALRQLPERQRYFPALRAFAGFKQVPFVCDRGSRYDHRSRVGYAGLVRLAAQAFFSHTRAIPYLLYGLAGALLGTAGLGIVYRLLCAVSGLSPIRGSGFAVAGALLTGLVLFGQALVCDQLSRIHGEVTGRPVYIVDRIRRAQSVKP